MNGILGRTNSKTFGSALLCILIASVIAWTDFETVRWVAFGCLSVVILTIAISWRRDLRRLKKTEY